MVAKRAAKSSGTTRRSTTSTSSGSTREPPGSTPAASKGVFIGVQSRGVFALPAEIRKRHHLDQPGAQLLVIEREDGVLELHPQLAVPADQKWFWSERWQAMEAQASADIAAGRVAEHDSAEELFGHLDGLRESS